MQEAQKMVTRSPKTTHRSPSPCNVSLPDTTGSSIMELLHDFSRETEESPEVRKRSGMYHLLIAIVFKILNYNTSIIPTPMAFLNVCWWFRVKRYINKLKRNFWALLKSQSVM